MLQLLSRPAICARPQVRSLTAATPATCSSYLLVSKGAPARPVYLSTGRLMNIICRQLLSALAEAQSVLRQELRVEAPRADSLIPQDVQESATEVTLRHGSAGSTAACLWGAHILQRKPAEVVNIWPFYQNVMICHVHLKEAMRIESVPACGHSQGSNEVARRLQNSCQQHQHSLRGKASSAFILAAHCEQGKGICSSIVRKCHTKDGCGLCWALLHLVPPVRMKEHVMMQGWYESHQPEKPHTCPVGEASLRLELQHTLHITPGAALSDIRCGIACMV